MPAILNGANEMAVELFLKNKIRFLQIPELIEKSMEEFKDEVNKEMTLQNIIDLDSRVKQYVRNNS